MNTARRAAPSTVARARASIFSSAHSRTPAYRRLRTAHPPSSSSSSPSTMLPRLSATLAPLRFPSSLLQARAFHTSILRPQQPQAQSQPEPQPRPQQQSQPQQPASERTQKDEGTASADDASSRTKQDGEADSEGGEGARNKDEKKTTGEEEAPPPPPPHGDKTPWQVFVETMQSEFKQSKEWNDSTKALADGAHQLSESESVQRARKAYEATSGAVSSTASNVLKTTATAVGKGASWTWETPVMKGVRKGASATGDVLDKATKPIRETEAYKNVKDVIDDGSSSRYGGWVDKEERRRRREKWLRAQGRTPGTPEVFAENPDAGTNVTVHKDAAWKEAWRGYKDSSRLVQGFFTMKDVYHESENPLISTARSITDRVAGFFAENETAMVIKKLREMDPTFQLEPFLRELREYILPEVLDAYVKGDVETLKLWLSEAQFSVYEALTKQYLQAGLISDGRILDIRHVDILKARMLEPGEIPVFIITCRTQEIHVYRKVKTGELAAGMEDKVQLVTYAIGVTRLPGDVNNVETRGWRLIEMQKSGRDYI